MGNRPNFKLPGPATLNARVFVQWARRRVVLLVTGQQVFMGGYLVGGGECSPRVPGVWHSLGSFFEHTTRAMAVPQLHYVVPEGTGGRSRSVRPDSGPDPPN